MSNKGGQDGNPLPWGDACTTCGHPFVRSFFNFEVLPLVEFEPEPGYVGGILGNLNEGGLLGIISPISGGGCIKVSPSGGVFGYSSRRINCF